MLRSMFSGVSGLRAHQTMMDVVGNNIANVNTVGYKSSRVTFGDTLSQLQRGGSGSGVLASAGGINPQQVGLGVRVGAIDTVNTQGSQQITNRATDLFIQGEGYFVVSNGNDTYFTRAGAFTPDEQGRLTDLSGSVLQGYPAAADGSFDTTGGYAPIQITIGSAAADNPAALLRSYSIGPDGTVNGVYSDNVTRPLAKVALATFANPGGLVREGDNHLRADVNSGQPQVGVPGDVGKGNLVAGALEMSNVDLAQEFTNLIIAQRGFQANSKIITASDEILQDLVNLKR